MDNSKEHILIKAHYGNRKAKRSGVPLMNHIYEGWYILRKIGASKDAQRAFYIHPLIQADDDLANNWVYVSSIVQPTVVTLAMEYRNIANQYLSHREIDSIDEIKLSPLKEVNDMLIADKIQNYKDFIIYHRGTHERSDELDQYFNNWLQRLKVADFDEWFKELTEVFNV